MSADGPAYTWTVSDDRRLVTVYPRRGATISMGFPEPLSDERLKETLTALERDALGTTYGSKLQPGQKNSYRRIVTRWGTLYPSLHTGPPTWYIPRIKFNTDRDVSRKPRGHRTSVYRVEIMLGWWRCAVALSWRLGEW